MSWLTNKIRIWCERAGFGYFAIWVRENYVGDRREHLHMMLYVPERQQPAFEAALRRWLPGEDRAVHLGKPQYHTDRFGRQTNKGLTYLLKQMTPQARCALGWRIRREPHCRETGAPVAAVLGRRCGVSRSLDKPTRDTFWASRSTSLRAGRLVGGPVGRLPSRYA